MAARVTIVPHGEALAYITANPNGAVMLDLIRRGNRVLNEARRRAPVNTGALRASLTMEQLTVGGQPAVRIGSNLKYAIWVLEGHGPIVPVRATILRWPSINNSGSGTRRYRGGATAGYVFAKRVRAVAGVHFLTDALDAAR